MPKNFTHLPRLPTCPENLSTCPDYPLAQKIYSKHMPIKFLKKNPDPDPGLVRILWGSGFGLFVRILWTRRRWAKIIIRKKGGEYVHGGEDETLNSLPPNRETTMVRSSHHYYYFQSSHLHPQQKTRLGTLTPSYLVPHCRFCHPTKPKSSTGFRLLHLGFPN